MVFAIYSSVRCLLSGSRVEEEKKDRPANHAKSDVGGDETKAKLKKRMSLKRVKKKVEKARND